MPGNAALGLGDLEEYFHQPPGVAERIGIEVECGLVDPLSGSSAGYEGPAGSRALLKALLTKRGGEPVMEGEYLLGVVLQDGAFVSLEMGGALEYSSAPASSLSSVVSTSSAEIEFIADLARNLGIAVLSGAMLPFTKISQVPWIPKRRVEIMRNYFSRLGNNGSLADGVMGLTLSTQVSLDYTSEEDLAAKLGMLVAVSPVVAALFVNSPLEAGKLTGALSRRLQFWRKIDPSRCGVLPFAVRQDVRISDITQWALGLPMIYRPVGLSHTKAPNLPFRRLLREGFGDGSPVTLADWASHLSQVWPHVRVRRALEMRILDGLPWPDFGAAAALWTGLAYNRSSLDAAWQLVRERTVPELDAAVDEIAVKGLCATLGPDSVQDLGREIIRLAKSGLKDRVKVGLEPSTVLQLLDPIERVAETGITFADNCVDLWNGPLRRSAPNYVSHFRI
jgi:glutamate--cysteine ligase